MIVMLTLAAILAVEEPPSPTESLAALRLADPNLKVELVAAEPLVIDPVAIAWDEHGALYVAEMGDYPSEGPAGRVKRLTDTDGDGVYDAATTFAEALPYPSGVAPHRGGILVTAAPDLLWLRDTDGDGAADRREVVLTGFGEGNQQLRVNNPTWGLDGWLYLANGRSGGSVRRPFDPPDRGLSIPRNDVRLEPRSGRVEAIAGFSQFGLPRDDWGNRFPSWNTVPIRHVVLEEPAAEEAASLPFEETRAVAEILDLSDGGRVYSLAPAPATFNHEAVAYFNASCGPTIYRDRLLGAEYAGDVFVCEPLTSLVQWRKLEADGVSFRARRVGREVEFLASTHSWFRPVNLATGPDGALYVVDFCRAWVEHPAFVPEERRNEANFREGDDKGRIWRVVPKSGPRRVAAWPGGLHGDERVALLDQPNGWMRDTAQRLLIEEPAEREDCRPKLARIAREGATPQGRAQALWTLAGLGMLDAEVIAAGLNDRDARVREQAVALAPRATGPRAAEVLNSLERLAGDDDPRVRLRVVLGHPPFGVERILAQVARRDAGDAWITRAIVRRAARASVLELVEALVNEDATWLDSPEAEEGRLLTRLGAAAKANGVPVAIEDLWEIFGRLDRPGAFAFLSGVIGEGGGKRGVGRAELEREVLRVGPGILGSSERPTWLRLLALEALDRVASGAWDPRSRVALLEPGVEMALQMAAARSLVSGERSDGFDEVLDRWEALPIGVRQAVLAEMARTTERARLLLDAVEAERISPREIDRTLAENLRALKAEDLGPRIDTLPAARPVEARADVLAAFDGAATREGDGRRGAALFTRHCRTCHARDGDGAKVGPDLIGVVGRPARDLLVSILDPNRDVPPDGIGFVVATRSGEVHSGLLVEEAADRFVLRQAGGVDQSIPRSEVEALRSTGRSLMPEGFEQTLSEEDLADVIAFLRRPPEPSAR
jgi:putative membrane-bound dehydrogenase-like protein